MCPDERKSIVKEEGENKYRRQQIVPTIVGKNTRNELIVVTYGCQIKRHREYKF